jgi:hypothetical protein
MLVEVTDAQWLRWIGGHLSASDRRRERDPIVILPRPPAPPPTAATPADLRALMPVVVVEAEE